MLDHIGFCIKLMFVMSTKQNISIYFNSSDDYSQLLKLGFVIHIEAILMVVAPNC